MTFEITLVTPPFTILKCSQCKEKITIKHWGNYHDRINAAKRQAMRYHENHACKNHLDSWLKNFSPSMRRRTYGW